MLEEELKWGVTFIQYKHELQQSTDKEPMNLWCYQSEHCKVSDPKMRQHINMRHLSIIAFWDLNYDTIAVKGEKLLVCKKIQIVT